MVPSLCCIFLQRLVPAAHAAPGLLLSSKRLLLQGLPATLITSGRKQKKQVITFWGGISPAFTQPTGEFVRNVDCGFVQRFLSYTSTGKMACLAA